MRIAIFCHSVLSDWNHGNAHFLRGVATTLGDCGHTVQVFEPRDAWSVRNLVSDHGSEQLACVRDIYPGLSVTRYDLETLDLDETLGGVDLVIVHEWNDHDLVRRLGLHRARTGMYRLLFHDTHHRAISDPRAMDAYDLRHYDGVLAFGAILRDLYLERRWARRAWVWHEAADTRVFGYVPGAPRQGDVIWIGNWGDDERTAELNEFLLQPVKELGLRARIYGVRYPEAAQGALRDAGIEYCGWLPNYRAPEVFARFKATVHVPRRPYVEMLRGIPTIRVFEALACGIPLVAAPWDDCEGLFQPGRDFLVAANGEEMKQHLRALVEDDGMARELALHGRQTILARHTCAHRVNELMEICAELGIRTESALANAHA